MADSIVYFDLAADDEDWKCGCGHSAVLLLIVAGFRSEHWCLECALKRLLDEDEREDVRDCVRLAMVGRDEDGRYCFTCGYSWAVTPTRSSEDCPRCESDDTDVI